MYSIRQVTRYATISCLFACCVVLFAFTKTSPVYGQTFDRNMAFGIAYDLWQMPEETEFEPDGVRPHFTFDWDLSKPWIGIRLGYHSWTRTKIEFDAYQKTWEGKLTTDSLYAAYRFTLAFRPKLETFVLLGVANVNAALEFNHGATRQTDTGIGILTGIGAVYEVNDFGLGAQIEILSREADFADTQIAVGANRLQLLASYHF